MIQFKMEENFKTDWSSILLYVCKVSLNQCCNERKKYILLYDKTLCDGQLDNSGSNIDSRKINK